MQQKLTKGPLLDVQGKLCQAGYATALVKDYDPKAIGKSRLRLKEWDYYLVTNSQFAVALTIADNGYMGLDSISLIDFNMRWQHTKSPMRILPMGKTGLPPSSKQGDVGVAGKKYSIEFLNDGRTRRLIAKMDNFFDKKPIEVDVVLENPNQDSMVIATPFSGAPKAFYYNQKINCLPAHGKVLFDGRTYTFAQENSMGVLDWGRGIWTYSNTWYWGSASGWVDGGSFGFNIGYGFGDTSKASENMLFYQGKAHKISKVTFHIPMGEDHTENYLSPWKFDSDDGRFEMDFQPLLDRASYTSAVVIASDQHQVFGRFDGWVKLDSGERLRVDNLLGFAEKVKSRW